MAKRKLTERLRSDRKDDYHDYELRRARVVGGASGKDLANEVQVSAPAIYAYERLRCVPPREVAQKIAEALGENVDNLFPENLNKATREINRERRDRNNTRLEMHISILERAIEREPEEGSWYTSELKARVSELKSLSDPTPLEDIKEDELPLAHDDPIDKIDRIEVRDKARDLLGCLSDRQRQIIILRFGIRNNHNHTLKEVGRIIGVNKERVRQIESKAIRTMQGSIQFDNLEEFLENPYEPYVPEPRLTQAEIEDAKRREVDLTLRGVVSDMRVNKLYPRPYFSENVGYFSTAAINNGLKRKQKEEDLAHVFIGRQYWFKPSGKSSIDISTDMLELYIKDMEEHWQWIVSSLDSHGYCESPSALEGCDGRRGPAGVFRKTAVYRCGNNRFWFKQHENYPGFLAWARHGQPIFDAFVEQTGLPTASLRGKREAAIVYHPVKIRDIQQLE